MIQIFGIAGRIFHSVKPIRDELYRRFVKNNFPCAACKAWWGIDPCHTGPHGIGQKACDLTVIPLCRKCHRLFDADPIGFAAKHNLDVPLIIRTCRELYFITYPNRKPPGSEEAELARKEA